MEIDVRNIELLGRAKIKFFEDEFTETGKMEFLYKAMALNGFLDNIKTERHFEDALLTWGIIQY